MPFDLEAERRQETEDMWQFEGVLVNLSWRFRTTPRRMHAPSARRHDSEFGQGRRMGSKLAAAGRD